MTFSWCNWFITVFELCSQIRGLCGHRQIPIAKFGLQHNLLLGDDVVVSIYNATCSNNITNIQRPKFVLVSRKCAYDTQCQDGSRYSIQCCLYNPFRCRREEDQGFFCKE